MPRRLRLHLAGGFYHVTLRGNHQRDIFFAEGDRQLLNKIVARAIDKFGARLHAYCWMCNHVHLLMQAGTEPIGRPMRQIAAEYARAMQGKLKTTGHFFERRYHATLVDAESYLMELIRYIHLNPVRAGIVDEPSRFQWSSHHTYIGSRNESWVTTDFCLSMFSADRVRAVAAYQEFIGCRSDEAWAPLLETATGAANILGSDAFIARVQRMCAHPRARQGLDELIAEACRRFNVDLEMLNSPIRDAYLTKVRAWVAFQAAKRGIATRSAVARALGRSEATLRYAILAYPNELE